jgi:cytochrome o ubiquinol oxidase subunit 2
MKRHHQVIILLLVSVVTLISVATLLSSHPLSLIQTKGLIATQERGLMVQVVLFMLIVAVPVYLLIFFFAWHYRAGNKDAVYTPDWEHSKMDELVWWAIPFEIILILGALTWSSTHELDPHKPLASSDSPLVVQVVALNWKWLFIYPSQHIATLNYLEIPASQPVEFEITADAPMNSFWIPQLSGQIYAMTGMVNPLYVEADQPGVYDGGSANYSGDGFASMHFKTNVVSADKFTQWVASAKTSPNTLDAASFSTLAEPSLATTTSVYGEVSDTLYNTVVESFMDMSPTSPHHH